MKKTIHLLFQSMKISISSEITYRADFILSSIIALAGDLVIPFVTILIYQHGATFPGWSLYEVMLLQGLFMLTHAISTSFFQGIIWHTLSSIREGTFDLLLLKPTNELLTIMVSSFYLNPGPLLGGITLVVISISKIQNITYISTLMCIALCIISIFIQFSLNIIMGAVVFKWIGNSRVYEILASITAFGKYPITLFSKPLASILTWIIPISTLAYFPAAALLGGSLENIIPAIISVVVFFVFSIFLWKHMVKKYTSAGG